MKEVDTSYHIGEVYEVKMAAPLDLALPRKNYGRTDSAPGCWEEEFITDCNSGCFIVDCDQKVLWQDSVFLG